MRLKDLEGQFDSSTVEGDMIQFNDAQAQYFWKQRARVKWLLGGDKNTSFSHASTLEKRNNLRITRI